MYRIMSSAKKTFALLFLTCTLFYFSQRLLARTPGALLSRGGERVSLSWTRSTPSFPMNMSLAVGVGIAHHQAGEIPPSGFFSEFFFSMNGCEILSKMCLHYLRCYCFLFDSVNVMNYKY